MRRLGSTAALLSAALLGAVAASGQAAPGEQHCNQLHGKLTAVLAQDQASTTGMISGGGIINGTTQDVFLSSTPTPDGLSYTATFTVTTEHGALVTNDMGTLSFATGVFSESGMPDASSSTGDFAGATGEISIVGSTADFVNFTGKVSGQICVPNDTA
jgi:hypothetical protein